ncbi:MAG: tetratricopeptide repeat protein [Eubacteriales bacterium]
MGKNKIRIIGMLLMIAIATVACGNKEVETQITQGYELLEQLEYETALENFTAITQATDEQWRLIARGSGIAYMGLMEYEEAIVSLEEALSYSNGIVQPVDYDINYYLAAAYYKLGEYENAIATYASIVALEEQEQQAYYLMGVSKLQLGLIDEACADFEAAIACDTTNYQVLIDIVQNLNEAGEGERGAVYLQNVIDTVQDKLDYATSGMIYYYLEDYEMARLSLDEAKGSSEEVTLMLGKTYEELGDVNYAASVYRDYLATNPECVSIYNQLALCLMRQELYEEALVAVQDALLIEDNSMKQTLLYNEIMLYEYLQEYSTAAVLMESYLTKYPADEVAQREYEFLSTR